MLRWRRLLQEMNALKISKRRPPSHITRGACLMKRPTVTMIRSKKDRTMPKNKFLTVLACFVFCFQSAPALAEGMCPPGQYQTTPTGASGPVGCAPMPSNRAADNAWTPKWGGIARSKDNKTIGVSENADSETLAESLAIDDCKTLGGTGCTVENTYSNQCVAVAVNQKLSTHRFGKTLQEATSKALSQCNKRKSDKACWIYYSGCSLPVKADK